MTMRTKILGSTGCLGVTAPSLDRGVLKCVSWFLGAFVLVATAIAISPAPASAQTTGNNCLQDQYTAAGNHQTLNCTANDVKVAKVINIRGLDGAPLSTCNSGQNFSFVADFLVQTTANSSRSNIGLYFATADVNTQPTALTGSCSDNIIAPPHTCSGTGASALCGSSSYQELDNDGASGPDNCGDTSSTDPTVCLDANNNVVSCNSANVASTWPGTQIVTVEIDNFTCAAPTGSSQLVLPNCTSWQVPGKTLLCTSPPPSYPYVTAAIPGSPSKCNCDTIPLGITVQAPSVEVNKYCTTDATPGTTNTSCELTPEGGNVTYTVTVANKSNFGDIIVDQICDNVYGTVFKATGYSGTACATSGSIPSGNTTCSSMTVAAGATGSCTFTVTQDEAKTVKDIVNVSGHGSSAGSFGPTPSSEVTVTSGEAPTTGTITKSYGSTTNVCTTVRYKVEVANTSASNTDETITLSALQDSVFGDITTLHGSVLGTTCGVATDAHGLGTLADPYGEGTLPQTLAVGGGKYTCQFDARFCGAPTTITTTAGVCTAGYCSAGKSSATTCTTNAECDVTCTGVQHTNSVSATVTGDEGATDVVSLTPGTLKVNECINPQ